MENIKAIANGICEYLLTGTSKNCQTKANLPCIFFIFVKLRYTVIIQTLFYFFASVYRAEGASQPLSLGFRPHDIGIPCQIVCHIQ